MPDSKISVEVLPPTDLQKMEFVREVIDPHILDFEKWFSSPQRGNGYLSGFEKEILRAFLWWATKENSSD